MTSLTDLADSSPRPGPAAPAVQASAQTDPAPADAPFDPASAWARPEPLALPGNHGEPGVFIVDGDGRRIPIDPATPWQARPEPVEVPEHHGEAGTFVVDGEGNRTPGAVPLPPRERPKVDALQGQAGVFVVGKDGRRREHIGDLVARGDPVQANPAEGGTFHIDAAGRRTRQD